MESTALKNFKSLWAHACKSMWIEIAALRHLQSSILGQYASIPNNAVLTDWIYAPECRSRIDDTKKDFVLDKMPLLISSVATSRIVLLSAGFESYFDEFLQSYLRNRPKFFKDGSFTKDGDKAMGEILKCKGPVRRIEAMPLWTTAKIATIRQFLPALDEVYTLRNSIAHDAGIADSYTATKIKLLPLLAGQPIMATPIDIIEKMAPPIQKTAEFLDKKINPHNKTHS